MDRRKNTEYRQDTLDPSVGWSITLPWLYYPALAGSVFLEDSSIESQLMFKGGDLLSNRVSTLIFVVAVFSLRGEYLGLELLTNQLQVQRSHTLLKLSRAKLDE